MYGTAAKGRIGFISQNILAAGKALSLEPAAPEKLTYLTSIQHPSICVPIATPRPQALKMIDNLYGEP